MYQITTDREIKGFMPKRIFMSRIGKVATVRYLYEFVDELPKAFVEAWHEFN